MKDSRLSTAVYFAVNKAGGAFDYFVLVCLHTPKEKMIIDPCISLIMQ